MDVLRPNEMPWRVLALSNLILALAATSGCLTSATDCQTDADCFVGETCSTEGTCVVGMSPIDMTSDGVDADVDQNPGDSGTDPDLSSDMPSPDDMDQGGDMPPQVDMMEDMPAPLDMDRDDMPPPLDMQPSPQEIDAPEKLNFPEVTPGESIQQTFTIENLGEVALAIEGIQLASAGGMMSPFALSYPSTNAPDDPMMDASAPAPEIAPGGELSVRVTFSPTDADPVSDTILIESDDPDEGSFSVELAGNVPTSCLEFDLPSAANTTYTFDFGAVTIGERASRFVRMQNCSLTRQLSLDAIAVTNTDGGVFDVNRPFVNSLPVTLSPGEELDLELFYDPTTDFTNSGQLELSASIPNEPDSSRDTTIGLLGKGTMTICPVARAGAREVNVAAPTTPSLDTEPLKTVMLDGTASNPNGGPPIARYEWAMISKPDGSSSKLSNPQASQPTLFLDHVGRYVVELNVYNQSNQPACSRARVTIDATPAGVFYAELFWELPVTAADPRDPQSGTDLDLHMRRGMAPWNMIPDDIYWFNTTADWGVVGFDENPLFLLENADGYGPEVIEHQDPSLSETYELAVHIFSKGIHSDFNPRVNVYIDGTLDTSVVFGPPFMNDTFWLVGSFEPSRPDVFIEEGSAGSRTTAADFP